ncbi:MAG TPA: methyltransferase domain-containing protein [Chloroflexota bacterium]|nr:methyltransferase domain-containing protein [Chloroflexota bacterium]
MRAPRWYCQPASADFPGGLAAVMLMDFESLRSRATLQEWQFHSSVPIVGSLLSAIRRRVYAIASKWALRAAMQQQSEFNNQLLDRLEEMRVLEQQMDRLRDHVANLERQMVEADRATLEARRDLVETRIALNRGLQALDERLDRQEAVWAAQLRDVVADARRQWAERAALEQVQRTLAALQSHDEDLFGLLASARRHDHAPEAAATSPRGDGSASAATGDPSSDGVDRFLFAVRFRETDAEVIRRQEVFLQYFQSTTAVLDLGCGRGEFLKLLAQRGIPSVGVDHDPDMVTFCRQSGLRAELADAVDYLAGVEDNSLGGIFLGRVVEHLEPLVLVRLIDLSHQKLRPDAYFVAETINPTCLLALTTQCLMDLSRVQPLHPEVLRFLLQSAGFQGVTVHFSAPVPDEGRLKRLPAEDGLSPREQAWLAALDENVDRLNDFLYGHQEYHAVARKFAWPGRLASPAARRDLLITP